MSAGKCAKIAVLSAMALGGAFAAHGAMEIWGNVGGMGVTDVSFPVKDLSYTYPGWAWAGRDSGKTRTGIFGGTDRYPWPIDGIPPDVPNLAAAQMDSNGYPLEVPFKWMSGAAVLGEFFPCKSFLWQVPVKLFPYGTFTLIAEGAGRIDLGWAKDTTIILTGGRQVFHIPITTMPALNIFNGITFNVGFGPLQSGLALRIVRSEKSDHVRNIHLIMPDYNGGASWADDYETCPFTPKWLEDMRLFKVVRFMDWNQVNGTNIVEWKDRPRLSGCPDQKTYGKLPSAGLTINRLFVPYELQIKACNILGCDYWLNTPSRANADYIRNLAQLVNAQLNSNLKVYVEHANETWNGMFIGADWANSAAKYNPAANDWAKGHAFMAARNVKIFRDVMGADRIVGVIAGQAASSGVIDGILSALKDPVINPDGVTMDAAATAPYFDGPPDVRRVEWSTALKQQCLANNLRMLMYECGTLEAHGRDLYPVYSQALSDFQGDGFECYTAYVAIGGWGFFGDWGHKKYSGQPLDSAYKYKAMWDFARDNGTFNPSAPVPSCGSGSASIPAQPGAAPRPAALRTGLFSVDASGTAIRVASCSSRSARVEMVDASGALVGAANLAAGGAATFNAPGPGLYLVRLLGETGVESRQLMAGF